MRFMRRLLGARTDDAGKAAAVPPQEAESPEAEAASDTATGLVEQPAPLVEETVDAPTDKERDPIHSQDTARHAGSQVQRLRVGYLSDVGQERDHNEDTLLAFQGAHLSGEASDPFGFFVVADGMGGHQAGEVASGLAARLVTREVLSKVYVPFLLGKSTDAAMTPLTQLLEDAVHKANDQVHEQVPGGGTTLTCALIMGRRAYIAHVGDSRAYLLAGDDVKQVTQDHSYVSRLVELGELSPEEAAAHPQRHVLYRALGQGDSLEIDTYHHALPSGSRLLLCSDGLSGSVPDREIRRVLAAAATPQEACEELVKGANAAGGLDNITAMVIEAALD